MSALLKGTAAALVVRPLAARPAAKLEVVSAEPVSSPESVELEELRAQCERLTEALSAAREKMDSAIAEAIEEGRAQGRGEALADDEKKLALVAEALVRAAGAWEARLADLDGLAAQVAAASITKVFASWEDASELVVRAARSRLDTLRREAVIAIRVSAEDFPGDAALGAAAAKLGHADGRLAVDADLKAGECRIDLTLGAIDVGPGKQIAAVTALLDDLAEGRLA